MKKQIFYLASVAMVAGLAACSNDELENSFGYDLKSNELAASIQDAVSTRTNIDGKDLKWTKGDALSVYDENGSGNYKFVLKDGADGTKGLFAYSGNLDFTPTTAFYPYSTKNSNVKNGKIYLTLDGAPKNEIVYDADDPTEVKMPMVGTIEGQNIAFTNLTALVKINVVNMPTDVSRVALFSEDGYDIAGAAIAYISNKTLSIASSKNNSDHIIIKNGETESDFTSDDDAQGKEYDFYFIVPAGDYPTGLGVYFGDENSEDDGYGEAIYTACKEMQANHIYKKTLRFDTEGKLIEDSDVEEWNNELAGGEKTLTADLSDKKGTLFIPTAASTSTDPITLNLTIDGAGTNEVNIAATDPTKPTPQVNIVLTATGDSKESGVLNINLPKSSVTLSAPAATKAVSYAVTLAKVTSTTAADVLRIAEGVKVTELTVTEGNVYVEAKAAATVKAADTSRTNPIYVFNTKTDEEGDEDSATNGVQNLCDATYKMMFPQDGDVIPVAKETILKQTITIGKDKNVTLNLSAALYASAATTNAIKVENGGNLIITGTAEGSLNSDKTAGSATKATILVEEGGQVSLANATIANAGGVAVELTGANAKFELKSGAVSSSKESTPVAIVAESGSSVIINNAASTITGGVSITASTASITAKEIGALTVAGTGTGEVNVKATTVAGATVTDGTVKIAATTLGETVNVKGGDVEITADATTASETSLKVEGGKLTLKGGKISGKAEVAGTDATNVGTFVVEDGTISYGTTAAATITGTDHSVIEIKGGTIENTTGTADTDVALALKSTSGIAKATISGESTKISSKKGAIVLTGASDGDATKTPALTVNGGTITSSGASSAVITDGTGPADITINGGTIKNVKVEEQKETVQGTGISKTVAGSLAITGGTVQAATAVSTAAGTLTVSGTNEVKILGTSKAITAASGSVTLTNPNATYSVDSAVATKYSFQATAALDPLSIENGNFNGNITVAQNTNIHFISGGTFTNCDGLRDATNQINYLKQGRKLQWNETEGYYTVVVE
jgi:hypothetical protein